MKKRTRIFEDGESVDNLTEEEVSLLHLVPLIQTAWVCNAISKREKQIIYSAARKDSIDERHEFNDIIDEWLSYQPSQKFFDDCLLIISNSFQEMTVKERNSLKSKILGGCNEVAASAGGKSLMDVNHHVSLKEKKLLNKLTEFLN